MCKRQEQEAASVHRPAFVPRDLHRSILLMEEGAVNHRSPSLLAWSKLLANLLGSERAMQVFQNDLDILISKPQHFIYSFLINSGEYFLSRRRTIKWPRAMFWKWSMNKAFISPPPRAPIAGKACAAAFSETVIPKREASWFVSLTRAVLLVCTSSVLAMYSIDPDTYFASAPRIAK